MTVTGNSSININSDRAIQIPAGVRFSNSFAAVPSTYAEVQP